MLGITELGKHSCHADKIQRLEKISNYVGTNIDGGVTHHIQRALDTGIHYPFNDTVTTEPTIDPIATNGTGTEETSLVVTSAMAMLTFQV